MNRSELKFNALFDNLTILQKLTYLQINKLNFLYPNQQIGQLQRYQCISCIILLIVEISKSIDILFDIDILYRYSHIYWYIISLYKPTRIFEHDNMRHLDFHKASEIQGKLLSNWNYDGTNLNLSLQAYVLSNDDNGVSCFLIDVYEVSV